MNGKNTVSARWVSLLAVALLTSCSQMPLLDPKGPIGAAEKSLILTAFSLMLIVVIPVILMTFFFAWRYRASNSRATYSPKWAHSAKIETVMWLVPALIITTLGLLVWKTTHQLSPYRPLVSTKKPVRIEAVAMDWKWLFIYPDQNIATVNRIVFPTGVPVNFRITSDTVMASFFIPRLGSQIYAMTGMQTRLHLMADSDGVYTGRNFQFSGRGYASMHFKAIATSEKNFEKWVNQMKGARKTLDLAELKRLEQPAASDPIYYASVRPHLFEQIIGRWSPMTATTMQGKEEAPHVR